jgi:purine-nucleoside phosphorylase
MQSLYEQIQTCKAFLDAKTQNFEPQLGIILGTGLGGLLESVEIEYEIPYGEIPFFPVSTVASHLGKLIFGRLAGKKVVLMAGRFHYYEGYTMQQVTFPVRVLKALGVGLLIISNAVGSVQAEILTGDLVFIRDHINLQPENPLRGSNDERLGVRFPDMLKTYSPEHNQKALAYAQEMGIRAHIGVYAATPGPNLETPAEYQYIHRIGGDVVGMSTVPEVLVAKHSELPVWVVSVVSNQCYPLDIIRETSLEDVVSAVQKSEKKLAALVKKLIPEWV